MQKSIFFFYLTERFGSVMKSSTFELGLTKKNRRSDVFTVRNVLV